MKNRNTFGSLIMSMTVVWGCSNMDRDADRKHSGSVEYKKTIESNEGLNVGVDGTLSAKSNILPLKVDVNGKANIGYGDVQQNSTTEEKGADAVAAEQTDTVKAEASLEIDRDGHYDGNLAPHHAEGMKRCLEQLAFRPFKHFTRPDRIIFASVTALSGGVSVSDTVESQEPELTLIVASANILSAPRWDLLNPNGYYCVLATAELGSFLRVNLKKGAHLSEGKLNLSILSGGENISNVGISVLSNATVVDVP